MNHFNLEEIKSRYFINEFNMAESDYLGATAKYDIPNLIAEIDRLNQELSHQSNELDHPKLPTILEAVKLIERCLLALEDIGTNENLESFTLSAITHIQKFWGHQENNVKPLAIQDPNDALGIVKSTVSQLELISDLMLETDAYKHSLKHFVLELDMALEKLPTEA